MVAHLKWCGTSRTRARTSRRATEGVASMPELVWIIPAALLGLAIGIGATFWFLRYVIDRSNLDSARQRSAELITQGQKEAENLRKEAELKAKDEFFQKREEFNRETEKAK